MDYSFNGEIACKYGVEAATFVHYVYWWIRKNEANGKHFHDGRYWTYNSMAAFLELFPFLTQSRLRGIIDRLSKGGMLLIGNYNEVKYDRTQWYSLSDEVTALYENHKSKCENPQMEVRETTNRSVENHTPIPVNIPVNIPVINTDILSCASAQEKPKKGAMTPGLQNRFERFWAAYPRKVSKGQAERTWAKIAPDDGLTDRIIQAVETAKRQDRRFREVQYIPHPSTWLNGKEWENDYTEQQPPKRDNNPWADVAEI